MAPIEVFRHIAIFERQFVRALADPEQHRLQIVEIEQRQAFLVGDVKAIVSTPPGRVEVHQRASSSGPISVTVVRMGWPCWPNKVPQLHRARALPTGEADLGRARGENFMRFRGRDPEMQAGEIAFYIGDKGWHAGRGEALDKALQSHRLAVPVAPAISRDDWHAELELLRVGAPRRRRCKFPCRSSPATC